MTRIAITYRMDPEELSLHAFPSRTLRRLPLATLASEIPPTPAATATVTLSPDTDMARLSFACGATASSHPQRCPRTLWCLRLRRRTVPSALRKSEQNEKRSRMAEYQNIDD